MGHLGFSGLNARAMFKVPHHPNRPFSFRARRCFQGFGYAFMFIPVSQLAYSYLPKNKNKKGGEPNESLSQMGVGARDREWRSEDHQSVLVSNLTSVDGTVEQFVSSSSHYLLSRGTSGPDAIHHAYGLVASQMMQQATELAFMDHFHLLVPGGADRPSAGVSASALHDWHRGTGGTLTHSLFSSR